VKGDVEHDIPFHLPQKLRKREILSADRLCFDHASS
jgi:hypothetical protein